MFKFFLAVGELLCPSADNVSVQPFTRGLKTLETSDAFQPGLEVGVVAFDDVSGSGAVFEMGIIKQVFLPGLYGGYDVLQHSFSLGPVMEHMHQPPGDFIFRSFKHMLD